MEAGKTGKDRADDSRCIVLASHGKLAEAMLENVEMLLGTRKDVIALCLERDITPEEFMQSAREIIMQYGINNVLFFSDLLQGTPCIVLQMLGGEYADIFHITGMNFPGVLEAVSILENRKLSMQQVCEKIVDNARGGILKIEKA